MAQWCLFHHKEKLPIHSIFEEICENYESSMMFRSLLEMDYVQVRLQMQNDESAVSLSLKTLGELTKDCLENMMCKVYDLKGPGACTDAF